MTAEQLEQKYPDLFENCFDFSIGQGWMPILHTLCININASNNANPDGKVQFHQIKEKFGSLRIYVSYAQDSIDDVIHNWISFAEDLSEKICENCGKEAVAITEGWIKNLCVDCAEERKMKWRYKE